MAREPHKLVGQGQARVELSRMVRTEREYPGGGRSVAHSRKVVAIRTGEVAILADVPALLALLGERALHNKSGRARIARGAILAVRLSHQDTPVAD